MTKTKLMLGISILVVAYVFLFILSLGFRGNILIISVIGAAILYILNLSYFSSISKDVSPTFFKTMKEVDEKQKEVNKAWEKVRKVTEDIGTYEAVRYINQKRRRQKIKAYPKNHM